MSKYPIAARSIIENCYMDDYLDSSESIEESCCRIQQVIEINKAANWEMHGWASNSEKIMFSLNITNSTNDLVTMRSSNNNVEKVLGLQWLNLGDEFAFKINKIKIPFDLINGTKIPSKREFLRVIMSIFDSLGLLTPFTVQALNAKSQV